MKLRKSSLNVFLALVFAGASSAATIATTTGDFTVDLSTQTVVFQPDGASNVQVTGDFETAAVGTPFAGVLDQFDFFTDPTDFATGQYVITLGTRTSPLSAGFITLTGPDTFESIFTGRLRASFTFLGPSPGGGSGDVLGEFGNLPGFENCVNAAVSTCDVTARIVLSGNYSSGPGGFELRNVSVDASAIPEPSSVWLIVSGAVGLLFYRRRR